MKTLAQALALLTKRRVMTLGGAGTGHVASLASEIAGTPVRGSWWGHAKGRLIFQISEALADHPDVLVLKLVEDKVTFVHRALWPALYRRGTDAARLRVTLTGVSARAAALYGKVQKAGSLRIEKADKDAATELEGIVIVAQEHGEKGAHVTVVRSWDDWAPPAIRAAAKRLSTERAEAEIATACGWGASSLAALPAVQSTTTKKPKPKTRSR